MVIEKTLKNKDTNEILPNSLKAQYTSIWWDTPVTPNIPLPQKSLSDKRSNEKAFDSMINEVITAIESFPNNSEDKSSWKQATISTLKKLIKNQPILNLEYFDDYITDCFFRSTSNFVKESKTFDKDIAFNDIGQALRNMWIINIFQNIFNKEIKFTSSAFGYSMLYPYTDNYLDDACISMNEKKTFIERLTRRLKGENVSPSNIHEEKIFKLIDYIEAEYDRNKYPSVYNKLLLINEGQKNSLIQQEHLSLPYEKDILGVSIEKGGTSVLADGYLVSGDLNIEEEQFAYGYGFLLQLCDDIQDIKSDIESSNCTIMSQLAGKYFLDSLVNKLINYIINFIDSSQCFSCPDEQGLKKLIKDNCIYLILFATADNQKYFSKEYIRTIDVFLPFTLTYTKNIKRKIQKKFKRLNSNNQGTSLEEIIMSLLD